MVCAAVGLHPSARGVLRDLPQAGGPLRCCGVVPMPQPIEALTHRDGDSSGHAFARRRSELTRQALGLVVLDVLAHGGILPLGIRCSLRIAAAR